MTREYLVNTYETKEYYLPDNRHVVRIHYSTKFVYCTVVDPITLNQRQDIKIPRGHSECEDLVLEFQRLADLKYPKQLRHKSRDNVGTQRRGW